MRETSTKLTKDPQRAFVHPACSVCGSTGPSHPDDADSQDHGSARKTDYSHCRRRDPHDTRWALAQPIGKESEPDRWVQTLVLMAARAAIFARDRPDAIQTVRDDAISLGLLETEGAQGSVRPTNRCRFVTGGTRRILETTVRALVSHRHRRHAASGASVRTVIDDP
jgi:hypothetical protein